MNVVLSIHDLTRRSTGVSLYNIQNQHIFQFTTSHGGRQRSIWKFYRMVIFQFTTSQGGRQYGGFRPVLKLDLSIHDLTRRSTRNLLFRPGQSFPFNSRPHKEVDSPALSAVLPWGSFNSRPHKEVDADASDPQTRRSLSIHDLTRRSTRLNNLCAPDRYLSIHDLTRRSTVSVLRRCTFFVPFNSRPHKEVDQQCILNRIHHVNFQFTTSQGGRLPPVCRVMQGYDLSIHDLTRRSTLYTYKLGLRQNFQFTTSQGGRLQDPVQSSAPLRSFNSRPHKEVDEQRLLILTVSYIFQFTTSQGGRRQSETVP